jgi:DNA-binding transcriptional MerR regulator
MLYNTSSFEEGRMSDTTRNRQPQEVASRLEVSPSTLRRWSEEFSEFLSPEADSSEGKQHRRYSDEDLATLITVKGLMAEGLTYDQVREHLSEQSRGGRPDGPGSMALTDAALPLAPAMTFLADTLHNVADSQQAVLNSQAANRELLGVVLQDNFNLKEENTRLRERMLELERQVAQIRRDEETRRDSLRAELEARMQDMQRAVMMQSRSGCLGGLFGGGGGRPH